jgi:hypothetical protein
MGKVFIDRREGERRIGDRREISLDSQKLQQRRLETMADRRLGAERRQGERRLMN